MFLRTHFKVVGVSLSIIALLFYVGVKVNAADVNLINGITVDSTLDTPDDNVGDGICDDGAGNCTLRAAIEEANSDPDASTILFNIQEPADFTNNSQDGYTIFPQSSLPIITEQVTIDGYSQPGAKANTAPSPQPFNGTLLIELDGAGSQAAFPEIRGDNSVIKGLAIGGSSGSALLIGGDNIQILGNYIGTDHTGMVENPNALNGLNGGTSGFAGDDTIIGGVNPEDRNIISGNDGAGVTPNTGNDGWIIKGNYVGMGADGVTSVPNTFIGGPGAFSIDNCSDTVVGGPEEGATNLISGNNFFGLFPDNIDGLTIQGNIIGPDYKGDPVVNNPQIGGIGMPPINGGFTDAIIGGTSPGAGNLIAHNDGTGIAVISMFYNGSLIRSAEKVSILGNSIHSNDANSIFPLSASGLGIDLLDGDMMTMVTTTDGPTLNDSGDSDTGPNNYINFPVLNSVAQNGNQATINFSLDAADSPSDEYRIEFFANDQVDPSGYGEGQAFLGAATVSNGVNQQASFTLPGNLSLANKSISATTTAIDTTTGTGFGSTSEFSLALAASVNNSAISTLASTGSSASLFILLSTALTVIGSLLVVHRIKCN